MDSGLEGAGALATATAAATVLDPPAARTAVEGESCLNCGAALSGAYCSACGQKGHVHRSLAHAVEEFLHGVVHFDSKFWHTLPLLVARPGKLTREYIDGRRARYISPMALFLLTVFTMFFVFGFMGGPVLNDGAIVLDQNTAQEAQVDLRTRLAALDAEIAAKSGDPALANEVSGLKVARSVAAEGLKRLQPGATKVGGDARTVFDAIRDEARSGRLKANTGNPALDAKAQRALEDPEFVFYKMKQKGYKLSFLLVPISLPWMLLLFIGKKDVRAYDHVVFLLYSISFMSLLFVVVALVATAGIQHPTVYALLLLFVPVAHLYAQLKGGYRLGWFSAAWRTAVLSTFALLNLSLYVMGIALLGLLD